eukprot:TRINITY_DN9764_c0_g1_i1.p1 TRINITY_DN9764_c0_g1~~TRINITY_DN9764_c0_g1_i1.p1  ORF type:complete len:256 (+),score=28.35 TRINITY_DN9764_c0_g1_i1:108-875(+)
MSLRKRRQTLCFVVLAALLWILEVTEVAAQDDPIDTPEPPYEDDDYYYEDDGYYDDGEWYDYDDESHYYYDDPHHSIVPERRRPEESAPPHPPSKFYRRKPRPRRKPDYDRIHEHEESEDTTQYSNQAMYRNEVLGVTQEVVGKHYPGWRLRELKDVRITRGDEDRYEVEADIEREYERHDKHRDYQEGRLKYEVSQSKQGNVRIISVSMNPKEPKLKDPLMMLLLQMMKKGKLKYRGQIFKGLMSDCMLALSRC